MEIFKSTSRVNFMRVRKLAIGASAIVIALAIVSLAVQGFKYGIEFTGGVVVEVTYPEAVSTRQIRATLTAAGFEDQTVQQFGSPTDIVVRLPPKAGEASKEVAKGVVTALQAATPGVQEKRVTTVGPQVGSQLRTQGTLALLVALLLIFVYLMVRYEWRFALGGIFATLHDLFIVMGVFSITGWEFNLNVLAAILAMLGYSVNDTVVIFDRIRENFHRMRRGSVYEIVNVSVNQTLSRTIMTAGMTMLVVIALLVVGGPPLRGFSIALAIGITVGTYSSIYIASASAYMLGASRQHFIKKKKPGAEAENNQP
ncbi:MAG: protein translocase subunit SecF [Gammaproteobacteria bacterium]|nr:protein translocase subunit SecF [Gammaproteobacteria bacterium]